MSHYHCITLLINSVGFIEGTKTYGHFPSQPGSTKVFKEDNSNKNALLANLTICVDFSLY